VTTSRLLKFVPGYVVAAVCLVWIFHDVQWPRLLAGMAGIRWRWVLLAIVFDVICYVCQGWRWQLLLRPKGSVSTLKATEAIYIGLFVNALLPMRVGEVLRGHLVARWLDADFSAILPSMVVERLLDGILLVVSLGVAAIFVQQLPPEMLKASDVLGVAMVAGTVLFAFIVFREGAHPPEPEPPARFTRIHVIRRFMRVLEQDLREIGRSRELYLSFAVSFLLLLGQALAFWLIMWAYGLRLSFWAGAAIFLIMHLGTVIPSAPANLGTYQFFTVVGLVLFGVDKTVATGFSLVAFFLLTLPLWVAGALAASRTGTTFAAVRKEFDSL
jgi:uncharacterized protein (TIRG00374 family)